MQVNFPVGGGGTFPGLAKHPEPPITAVVALCDGTVMTLTGPLDAKAIANVREANEAAAARLTEKIAAMIVEQAAQAKVKISSEQIPLIELLTEPMKHKRPDKEVNHFVRRYTEAEVDAYDPCVNAPYLPTQADVKNLLLWQPRPSVPKSLVVESLGIGVGGGSGSGQVAMTGIGNADCAGGNADGGAAGRAFVGVDYGDPKGDKTAAYAVSNGLMPSGIAKQTKLNVQGAVSDEIVRSVSRELQRQAQALKNVRAMR